MAGHLCKRALIALLTIFIIITLSFLMVRFMPGDPLIHLVGEENYYYMKEFNPQELERLAEKYAMSGTLGQQYGNYLEQHSPSGLWHRLFQQPAGAAEHFG